MAKKLFVIMRNRTGILVESVPRDVALGHFAPLSTTKDLKQPTRCKAPRLPTSLVFCTVTGPYIRKKKSAPFIVPSFSTVF